MVRSPYQLISISLDSMPKQPMAVANPPSLALVWNTMSHPVGASSPDAKFTLSCASVDQGDICARQALAQARCQASDKARANNANAVTWACAAVPDSIQRGFHVGRKRSAARGDMFRDRAQLRLW